MFIFYSVVRQLFSVPVQRQTNKAYPQDNYYSINNTQEIHSHTIHRYDTDISRKHTTTQVKNNSIDYNYWYLCNQSLSPLTL
jgi:HJR/Mrr/RecB family endonuclease